MAEICILRAVYLFDRHAGISRIDKNQANDSGVTVRHVVIISLNPIININC